MLRTALAAALVFSCPALADDSPGVRPVPTFAAEGRQVKLTVVPSDGFDWAELTFQVRSCIAGRCSVRQHVKVLTPLSAWRGRHGETVGLVKYQWRDAVGGDRTWAIALRLEDADDNDRFVRESDQAVSNSGTPPADAALATHSR
jgi:hypothetical protein